MRTKHTRKRAGFTLIELLVVIVIILMVLAMAIPIVTTFMKNKGLSNAGSMVRAAATKARARAIATRDVHYLLIYLKDKQKYQVYSGSDSSCPYQEFSSGGGTILVIDENARAGTAAYSQWLYKVDEPMSLPKGAVFAGADSTSAYTDGVLELHFFSDGSLIMKNQQDHPGSALRKSASDYDTQLNQGEGFDWPKGHAAGSAGGYDLVITNKSFSSICLLDFIQNTGSIDSLVFPK